MLKFIEQGLIALCFVLIWKNGYHTGYNEGVEDATKNTTK